MKNKEPLVSVIIATRNEEKNIARCILSLVGQEYKNIELIVVDNNSSDKTIEIAAETAAKIYNLPDHVDIKKVKNYRGAQVNLGVKKCRGEIVFFPDADMTFDKKLIAEAVCLHNNFDALYIPEEIMGTGFLGKIRNFERSFYNCTCIDAPRFVKREIFLKVDGFDEREIAFAPDDWDLTKKLKKVSSKMSITKARKFHHEKQLNLTTYIKKKTNYIETFDDYIFKWGENDPDIKKQFGIRYRYLGVFVENEKWKKLLSKPDLAIGMYCLRLLVGISYLFYKTQNLQFFKKR